MIHTCILALGQYICLTLKNRASLCSCYESSNTGKYLWGVNTATKPPLFPFLPNARSFLLDSDRINQLQDFSCGFPSNMKYRLVWGTKTWSTHLPLGANSAVAIYQNVTLENAKFLRWLHFPEEADTLN